MKRLVTFLVFGIMVSGVAVGQNLSSSQIKVGADNSLAQITVTEYNHPAWFNEEEYAAQLEALGITLHPGTDYTEDSKSSPSSLNHCKSLVYRTLKSLPSEPVKKLKNLTLNFSDEGRRGLGGGSTIILRCKDVTDEELVGVLVHEMGHIMDTGVMNGTKGKSNFMDGDNVVAKNDPSAYFYSLSFEDEQTLKEDSSELDFVSGYAMSDPFEDFAETYAYYVLHGIEFRYLAIDNEVLQKKYDFMKKRVFKGEEYYNGGEDKVDVTVRSYDVTVLPYDMEKFFTI